MLTHNTILRLKQLVWDRKAKLDDLVEMHGRALNELTNEEHRKETCRLLEIYKADLESLETAVRELSAYGRQLEQEAA